MSVNKLTIIKDMQSKKSILSNSQHNKNPSSRNLFIYSAMKAKLWKFSIISTLSSLENLSKQEIKSILLPSSLKEKISCNV